jgi:hypothetical protein
MSRLNDHLNTMPRETQLIVRLGRALQAGEVRVRLSLLRMEEAEVRTTFPGFHLTSHILKIKFLHSTKNMIC